MSRSTLNAAVAIVMAASPAAMSAQSMAPDTVLIPERSIVVTGDRSKAAPEVIAILYSRENLDFHDPQAPRFLFLDREGKALLGIGGYVLGTMSYDFDGAIDATGFDTYDIPVPFNPSMRNAYRMDASHSTVFLRLIGKSSKFGSYQVYVQTNFTGGHGDYDLKLKQAYLKLGYVTAGLARSTFSDASQPPTVDPQGPSGQITAKNILFQYAPKLSNRWSMAVSFENPKTSYTVSDRCEAIHQRFPDIPVYLQYSWAGDSHVRLSGLFRNLSYRNLVTASNHFATGWGIQLSGQASPMPGMTLYLSGAYGKGIGQYVNDLEGNGFDLIRDGDNGTMKAPGMAGVTGGLRYDISDNIFVSASYSQCRLYDQSHLGGDTYRYGQYAVVNAFWNVFPECQIGLEYNYGRRTDCDHSYNSANRLWASLQYNF